MVSFRQPICTNLLGKRNIVCLEFKLPDAKMAMGSLTPPRERTYSPKSWANNVAQIVVFSERKLNCQRDLNED